MPHNQQGHNDFLVCPSLARNSSTDQTNTTGLDNNVPHIKEPDKRENVWHKRTPVHARANPNHISTQHMTYESHTCPERAIAQSLSIPFCRHRSSMPVHEPTETQRLVSKQLQIKTQRFDLQGWSASAQAWLTRERLQTEGAVDHRNKRVPSTWRPFSQETIAATLPTQDNCILFKPRIQNPRT